MSLNNSSLFVRLALSFAFPFLFATCANDEEDENLDCINTRITFDVFVTNCNDLNIDNESGGSAPYTYSVDVQNFQTEALFEDLEVGIYTVSAKDANGCSGILSFAITNSLSVGVVVDNFDITATASGGEEPYTYSIDGQNFQIGATFTVLTAGTYTISVKDAVGCVSTAQAVVE